MDTAEEAPNQDDSKLLCKNEPQQLTNDQSVGLTHADRRPAGRGSALIVEDVRIAEEHLIKHGYATSRLTHNELMALGGTEYFNRLLKGEYNLLWISTPADWYVRHDNTRANAHWQRVANWLRKAHALGMGIIIFGPGPTTGHLWRRLEDVRGELCLNEEKMRLCHFGHKYDQKDKRSSGSYMQVSTNLKLKRKKWTCKCSASFKSGKEGHSLDWYGKTEHHGSWRRKVMQHLTAELVGALIGRTNSVLLGKSGARQTILDGQTPAPPTPATPVADVLAHAPLAHAPVRVDIAEVSIAAVTNSNSNTPKMHAAHASPEECGVAARRSEFAAPFKS